MSKTATEFHLKVLFFLLNYSLTFFLIHQHPLITNIRIPREQSFSFIALPNCLWFFEGYQR